MPIIKSAKKKMRQDQRRSEFNDRIRRSMRLALKKYQRHPTDVLLRAAESSLDRAAKRRVIHKNKASRLKSKLARSLR